MHSSHTTHETAYSGDPYIHTSPVIAAALSVRPYGEERALLSYEARTVVTDPASRVAFLRYWRALSPFIGVLLQRTLTAMAR
jgi:hypothetical protein